jgi:hypothetical protein
MPNEQNPSQSTRSNMGMSEKASVAGVLQEKSIEKR